MIANKKNIVLFLLGFKGFKVLEAVVKEFGSQIIEAVVIAKDPNINNDYFNEIWLYCNNHNIKSYLRVDEFIINPNSYLFAIGWRWIIKEDYNLIVLHDSLLPKYRGFAPLVNCLINGEQKIGVTGIFASQQYDMGDIITQKDFTISYPIKIQQAIDIITNLYIQCIIEIINKIFANNLTSRKQEENFASYSLWRDEEDYYINWSDSSVNIKRFIDAVGEPYAGAKTLCDNVIYTIVDAEIIPDVNIENRKCHIGKVIFIYNGEPVIVCGNGLIKITKLINQNGNVALPLTKFRLRFK